MNSGSCGHPSAGIFLLVEGLPKTILESQVLSHVSNMEEAGINMEVWSFALTGQVYSQGVSSLPALQKSFPTVTLRLFRGVRPAVPFSDWFNALLLLWWLWRLSVKPAFVHARTEHATMIASLVKRIKKFHLIWDARGDSLSEFREEGSRQLRWRWMAPLKLNAISRRLRFAQTHCDAAIFVSEELRRLYAGRLTNTNTLVVPCLADETLFYFDPSVREVARRDLGYGKSDIVITYVGSTAPWQCVPETMAVMERALRANNLVKGLIVTSEPAVFQGLVPSDLRERVTVVSGRLHEMNRYLNAADLGLLLRKSNAINKVASPVKFAEYSLVGLTVVTTAAVEQVVEIGGMLGNTIDDRRLLEILGASGCEPWNRQQIAVKARGLLGRKAMANDLVEFYRFGQ